MPSPYPGRRLGAFRPRRIRRRGRRGLGQSSYASPSTAAISSSVQAQYFPATSSVAGFTQANLNNFLEAVQERYVPEGMISIINGCSYSAPSLANVPGATVATATTSAGAAAIKIAPATGPAAPFVYVAGAILDVIGLIFGAKAAKEQTEDKVLCQQLNNANTALAAIDAQLEAGTLTAAQASQAYTYLLSQYQSAVQSAGIINALPGQSTTKCDASCAFMRILEGIVAQRNIDLQNDPPPADTGTVAAATSAVSTTLSALPSWVWLVGAGVGLYLLAN
jgi:hypothetical protein